MDWQATDQFGNLYIGESSAQNVEELRQDISSLLVEVRERAGDSFRVTVDFAYSEISGPDPDRVTHVLRVPFLASVDRDKALEDIRETVAELCTESGDSTVDVQTG